MRKLYIKSVWEISKFKIIPKNSTHKICQTCHCPKLSFKRMTATLWVRMEGGHTGLWLQPPQKTKDLNVVCESLHSSECDGRKDGCVRWMRSHPGLKGKRPVLWGLQASRHQWVAHVKRPHSTPLPMFVNYTIVLSHSILPRLIRHHLLSLQKAL